MPYGEPYSPLDGLGAITTVKEFLARYRRIKRKNRLRWIEKRLTEFKKQLDKAVEKLATAKKAKAKKFLSRRIKVINKMIASANKMKAMEEARLGIAPPPPTPIQVDQAIEVGQTETKLEEIADTKEETPEHVASERRSKFIGKRISTALTEIMSDIEATENIPFRMYLLPVVREGVAHTEVKIEPLEDLSPEAVKGYTLRRTRGGWVIEPIAESVTPVAGLGVAVVAVTAAVEAAREAKEAGVPIGIAEETVKEELGKLFSQGGESFDLKTFIQNNVGDIKTELSDKVYKATGGAFGKKKKKVKWYQKHGWKNSPPKDCPRYKDKTGNKHAMYRAAYRLWKKLGKPDMAYGKRELAGMRALEVLVKARKKKAWLFRVISKKAKEAGLTPYDAINWAVQNIPGFNPREAGVPDEAVSASEIEAANRDAGENPVIRPDVPLLETTGGKVAVGGGAFLIARALGLF